MNRNQIFNRSVKELFLMISDLGESVQNFVFTPYGKLRISEIPRTTYYNRVRKFERLGLVKKIKKPTGYEYHLTEKAKQLRRQPIKKTNRTDGLTTIIMFDIPEAKHRARDNFRRYLIRNGYTQIQKSVLVSPFKVSSELKTLAVELGIDSNLTYMAGRLDLVA